MMDRRDITKRLATSLKAFNDFAEESLLAELDYYSTDYADDLCKSDIEKTFFLAWVAARLRDQWFGSAHGGSAIYSVHPPEFSGAVGQLETNREDVYQLDELAAQYPIDKYRADFCISRRVLAVQLGRFIISPIIVVECDGHDWHERTKEQAAHDKARDRELQCQGYFVLRFTGSEIFRDPNKCVGQVDEFLEEHISRAIIASRAPVSV